MMILTIGIPKMVPPISGKPQIQLIGRQNYDWLSGRGVGSESLLEPTRPITFDVTVRCKFVGVGVLPLSYRHLFSGKGRGGRPRAEGP